MEAVGHMAGGMAHNFNNNLAIILGNLELARAQSADRAAVLSYLDNAMTSVLRSRDLIQQILSYSREGHKKKNESGVNISEVVRETIKLIESTLPATVQLIQHAAPDVDELVVLANFTDLQDALLNLCRNAVHAMNENGDLAISVSRSELKQEEIPVQYEAQPGPFACLCVEDTGCGIPSEIVGQIFDPFFSTKEVNEGTGMGLSTVQGMIKKCGGIARVDSELGKGTRIELLFPLTELSLEPDEMAVNNSAPQGHGRILLVDDDLPLATVLAEILDNFGYTVTVAPSGPQALDIFRSNPKNFDLVLTDQTMPAMTGEELLTQLKLEAPQLLTALYTGYSAKIDKQTATEKGIDLFMMKPLEMDSLAHRLRDLFISKGFQAT
jgi:CheY-like chemotaxis protein/two-component sensor histidine kinase